MPLTNLFQAVAILGAGLWVVCGSVFATAGWTAPPCLASAAASAVGLVLGGFTDYHARAHGGTRTNRRDGAYNTSLNASSPSVDYYRLHDSGWLEHYHGRLGELYGTNESVTMVNTKTGHVHNVNMWENRLVVRTDVKQVPHTLGRTTTNRHRNAEAPILGKPETFSTARTKRITSSESKEELSSYFFSGSELAQAASFTDSKAANSYTGVAIANQAYALGSYCMTLSDTGGNTPFTIGNIGVNLIGLNMKPKGTGPCAATKPQ